MIPCEGGLIFGMEIKTNYKLHKGLKRKARQVCLCSTIWTQDNSTCFTGAFKNKTLRK